MAIQYGSLLRKCVSWANILPMEKEIRGLIDSWGTAVYNGNVAIVLDMYSDDAVLLPTLSNTICNNRKTRETYFNGFMAKKPTCEVNDSFVSVLGDDAATHVGIYTFTFEDGSSAQARFSFVYQRVSNEWKITHHHSSLMPEPE